MIQYIFLILLGICYNKILKYENIIVYLCMYLFYLFIHKKCNIIRFYDYDFYINVKLILIKKKLNPLIHPL